jgi:hypothetical protein
MLKQYSSAGKYAFYSGALEPRFSEGWWYFVRSLPPFLRDVLLEEVAQEEAAKKSSPSSDGLKVSETKHEVRKWKTTCLTIRIIMRLRRLRDLNL